MSTQDAWRNEQVTPDDFPVLWPATTRWLDNDSYGHLNNAVYYLLFDTAVNGWLMNAVGGDTRELPAIGVVAETGCRFLREVSFPDRLQIGLALERRGTSSVTYRLAVFREDAQGRPLSAPHAIGTFVHVYVDRDGRRPTAIPETIAAALTQLDPESAHRR